MCTFYLQVLCEFDRIMKHDAADHFARIFNDVRAKKIVNLQQKKKSADFFNKQVGSVNNIEMQHK